MQLLLAQPHGPCAGVRRAIETVERALALHGAPVHVFHEIVHNGHVVSALRDQGVVFVERVGQVPRGAVLVYSAHGVSRAVEAEAAARGLRIVDATCPLVAKVHEQLRRHAAQGRALVLIGRAGHDEVVGTMGSVDAPVTLVQTLADVAMLPFPPDSAVAYATQTTLSLDETGRLIDALRQRYPHLVGPGLDDICYATQHRQQAVQALTREVGLVIVVGDHHSSNARRLQEVAQAGGVPARLVAHAGELDPAWWQGVTLIGLSAAASTPEVLVDGVIARMRALGATALRRMPGPSEAHIAFALPASVGAKAAARPPPAAAPARPAARAGLAGHLARADLGDVHALPRA